MGRNSKRTLSIAMMGVLCSLLASLTVYGADFPKKPVKMIVCSAAGGGEDLEARAIAPFVEKYLGVSVGIENQPGAGGKIAFEKFQRTEPDGYNLIMYTFPKSVIIEYIDKTNFRTKDFTPVFAWSRGNQVLVVHADTWKTFDEFLKAAKARTLSGGLSGRGSTTHLAGLVAVDELGIKVNWVPYEGSAGSVTALAGKHLDFTLCLSTSAVSLTKAGKIRPLVVFSDKRDTYLPEVPIPKELGFDVTPIPGIRGVEAPPRTSASIVKVLEEAYSKAIKEPAFIEVAKNRQILLQPLSSKEYGQLVQATYPKVEKYKEMLREK
jgi:tripartite-type tricarboxylate transporter receptor subunit TctC